MFWFDEDVKFLDHLSNFQLRRKDSFFFHPDSYDADVFCNVTGIGMCVVGGLY